MKRDLQKKPTQEVTTAHTYQQTISKETYISEKRPAKETYQSSHHSTHIPTNDIKRATLFKMRPHKRLTTKYHQKETYKIPPKRPTKETYKRDLQKRPIDTHETDRRDQQKRP